MKRLIILAALIAVAATNDWDNITNGYSSGDILWTNTDNLLIIETNMPGFFMVMSNFTYPTNPPTEDYWRYPDYSIPCNVVINLRFKPIVTFNSTGAEGCCWQITFTNKDYK